MPPLAHCLGFFLFLSISLFSSVSFSLSLPHGSPAAHALAAGPALEARDVNYQHTYPWSLPAQSQPAGRCRCFPGDACWPTPETWSAFNATINGKLIATTPIAAPCHDTSFGPYDPTVCASLQAAWFGPELHYESPSSIMAPYFTNNSCNPFLPKSASCIVGSYVSYSVNVSEPMDIARTIRFATYFNIRIVIKNTGHDYSGKSSGAGAIAIWTHNMKDISFVDYKSSNYTGKAIKAAAGVLVIDAFKAASAKGLAVVGGECPTVGYSGGYTQGGGHSALASKYGLAADQVLEWEVVDGRGQLLCASPTENADLYWALAGGGGGTFGVVTSMTSKAHPDIPVTGASLSFTNDGVTQDQYYDVLSTFQASLPKIVDAGAMVVWFFTNTSFFIAPLTAPGLSTEQVAQLLLPITNKLSELGINYLHNIQQFPGYLQQFNAMSQPSPVGVGQYGGRFIPRSVVEKNNAGLTAAYRYINEHGGQIAGIGLSVSKAVAGNVWNSVHPGWRDALIETVIQTPYDYTVPLADMVASQSEMTNDLMPQLARLTPNGGAYLSESDFRQPDFQSVFYGTNYDRLNAIKNRYDPFHMFYAVTAVGSEYWVPQQDGRLCKA
ncbi:Uncharacterized protein BP5553_01322 [Venustampulla echinocandica]|uniref:FAD-binding PCMH-type domain-containing protein n=1 Tax=Venustampulla echinocandica TaxID=2656787 RepID=A0A370U0R6_9HELO|nr:Uncharacterized protein BP5553_01322 [Venustampulla echinocandica]RDL41343.1 Uncharacterized protein BP5553_01322 [Venustampulla echinocandica]